MFPDGIKLSQSESEQSDDLIRLRQIIDERYSGEVMIVHRKMDSHSPYYCNVGGKVAQLLIRRRERIVWEEVESLEDLGKSDRGDNGFGSTDKINNE